VADKDFSQTGRKGRPLSSITKHGGNMLTMENIDISKLMEEKFGLITKEEARKRMNLDEDDFIKEFPKLTVVVEQSAELVEVKSVTAWLKKYDATYDRRVVHSSEIYAKLTAMHYIPPHAKDFTKEGRYRKSEEADAIKSGEVYQEKMRDYEDRLRPFFELVMEMHEGDKLRDLKHAIGAVSFSYPKMTQDIWNFVCAGFSRRDFDLPAPFIRAKKKEAMDFLGMEEFNEKRSKYMVLDSLRADGEDFVSGQIVELTDKQATPLLDMKIVEKVLSV
jgi:hypothetical protein